MEAAAQAKPAFIRVRLSAMMFIQFFVWASWYVPMGGYANSVLKLTGGQIGWLYATTAIAAMVSPLFVGFVADRLFATERIVATLHLLGAVCLFLAAQQTDFAGLMTFLVINALCFMPTLALANSLAFRNIDDRDKFSRVAVWGTIGWILSGWTVDFVLGGAGKAIFYLAGCGGVAMAVYSLVGLPHTPPKGKDASGGDVLGLGAVKLMKDPVFLIFAVCAFLISIPLSFYFTWGNAFLVETDRPIPTTLQTLCQFSEIFVMIIMPWFITRIGLKYVIVIGMAAWAIRYVCFASMVFPLVLLGLLVHGFCYCFVFIAAFIFADKKAPQGMSASAQSLVAFIIWGVGMFLGTKIAGFTAGEYPPMTIPAVKQVAAAAAEKIDSAALPDWMTEVQGVESEKSFFDQFLAKFKGEEKVMTPQLPVLVKAKDMTKIALAEIEALPEEGIGVPTKGPDGAVTGSLQFAKKDLLEAFKKADADKDNAVTDAEWRVAQAHTWPPIWLWPAVLSAIACLIFLAGGREPKAA